MRPILALGIFLTRPQRRRARTGIFVAVGRLFSPSQRCLRAVAGRNRVGNRQRRPRNGCSAAAHHCQFANSRSWHRLKRRTPLRSPAATTIPIRRPTSRSRPLQCAAHIGTEQRSAGSFFANLLWQESGLRNDVVSSKGALGIAQFMPQTAEELGLHDPFDPLQAIPASARLLRALRMQFGNLGFVAAAYNAGARRVSEWLERRRGLPRETRGYVANVTGRSVDQWRTTPPDDATLKFVRRLPCRELPAFANLEQEQHEQLKQAEADRAEADQAQGEQAQPQRTHTLRQVAEARHRAHRRAEARKAAHPKARHEAVHTAARNIRRGKHQAEHTQRTSHDKRKSA